MYVHYLGSITTVMTFDNQKKSYIHAHSTGGTDFRRLVNIETSLSTVVRQENMGPVTDAI